VVPRHGQSVLDMRDVRVHRAEHLTSQGRYDRRQSRQSHLRQKKTSRAGWRRRASWPRPSAVTSRRASQ
jgi:hypothetical protein